MKWIDFSLPEQYIRQPLPARSFQIEELDLTAWRR